MSKELTNWLEANKIRFQIIDDDVIEVVGFGKMYYA